MYLNRGLVVCCSAEDFRLAGRDGSVGFYEFCEDSAIGLYTQ